MASFSNLERNDLNQIKNQINSANVYENFINTNGDYTNDSKKLFNKRGKNLNIDNNEYQLDQQKSQQNPNTSICININNYSINPNNKQQKIFNETDIVHINEFKIYSDETENKKFNNSNTINNYYTTHVNLDANLLNNINNLSSNNNSNSLQKFGMTTNKTNYANTSINNIPSKMNQTFPSEEKKLNNNNSNSSNSKLLQSQISSTDFTSNFISNYKLNSNSLTNQNDNINTLSYILDGENNNNFTGNIFSLGLDLKEPKISIKKDTNEIFDDIEKGVANYYSQNQFIQDNEFFNFNSENDFQGENFINIANYNIKDNFENEHLPSSHNFISNTFNNEFKEDSDIDFQKKFIKQEDSPSMGK